MLVTLLGIGDMALDKTDKDLAHSLVRKNDSWTRDVICHDCHLTALSPLLSFI